MLATRERTDYERERGKSLPSRNHSRVQLRLGSVFLDYEPDVTSFSELTLDLDGLRVTPDLCVHGSRGRPVGRVCERVT